MSEPKIDIPWLTTVMILSCVACTGLLVGLDSQTGPLIEAHAIEKAIRGRKSVLPRETVKVDEEGKACVLDLASRWNESGKDYLMILPAEARQAKKATLYRGYDADGKITGFSMEGELPDGYGGILKFQVGVRYDMGLHQFRIANARVNEHRETPGLGANIDQVKYDEAVSARQEKRDPIPWFLANFRDRTADKTILKKEGGPPDGVDALTAATITSKGFTHAMKRVLEMCNQNQQEMLAGGTPAAPAPEGKG